MHGFFSLLTWLTAIAGSVILLAAYRAIDARTGHIQAETGNVRPARHLN
jgi:hypothetical protein